MAWIYPELQLSPPSSEPSTAGPARAKRRGCLSAASSAPSLGGPRSAGHRRAQHVGSRPAACFFGYFLCTSKESDKHDHCGYENGTFAGAVSM